MTLAGHAFAAVRERLPFFWRKEQSSTINGHAIVVANPTYQRLLNAEPWFRGLIPVSIITFLILIGIARSIQLTENRDETLVKAEENLTLIATVIEHQFDEINPTLKGSQRTNKLMAALANAKPAGATRDGRVLLIASPDGLIQAMEPLSGHQRKIYLSDLLEPTQPLLTFGKKAGVMTLTMLDNEEQALVTARHLPNNLGSIIIFQPKEALLTQWRADVSLNASIFLGTGLLLIIVLYAFFSQTTRADEADQIYHKTYGLFDTALKRGKCGLWDWDIARAQVFWSPSMFEILGLEPRQSLIGFGDIQNIIHPQDAKLMVTAERILSEGLTHIDQIYRMRHAQGHWISVRMRGETVVTNNDEAPHLVGICIDISEQVRLARDNKTANSRLRDSIETLSEAFVLWDAKNRLVVCNEKYRDLNGLPYELALPGVPYAEIMEAASSPQAIFQSTHITCGDSTGRTFETALQDGRWLQINERRTNDGSYVTIGTDITKIKRNEENLRIREQELSATIKHLEQSETGLRNLASLYSRQREVAQNANRAKAEFLANISHEWRTPLNAIIGFSDMMRHGAFGPLGSEKYREYCDDINESGTYLLDFINDVIDMSEIEAGRFALNKENINAVEIISSTVDALHREADQGNITVKPKLPDTLTIHADPRAFKQIIHNILSNALKFNKSGGIVKVECALVGDMINLTISDTGIGISADLIDELGRPFKQVQNQMTKNHTGSGLGLAISMSLVEMHEGTLNINSKPGKGTKVAIIMPASSKKTDA